VHRGDPALAGGCRPSRVRRPGSGRLRWLPRAHGRGEHRHAQAAARTSPRMLSIFASPRSMAGCCCPGAVSCIRLVGSGSPWLGSLLVAVKAFETAYKRNSPGPLRRSPVTLTSCWRSSSLKPPRDQRRDADAPHLAVLVRAGASFVKGLEAMEGRRQRSALSCCSRTFSGVRVPFVRAGVPW
jgi:hypothetical protein